MGIPTLYLVPTDLGGAPPAALVPEATRAVVHRLRHFVVEDAKSARRFLKSLGYPAPLREAQLQILNKDTAPGDIGALLAPLRSGHDVGLLSEAGCPAVADPGALLVGAAHAAGIRVAPLVGASAIVLALMGSGMDGQRFAFHGYLPRSPSERHARLVELEARSARDHATQIFIETPYRNNAMVASLLATCRPDTLLCIAADLTAQTQLLRTQTVAAWRRETPDLDRRPAVFLLYRGAS